MELFDALVPWREGAAGKPGPTMNEATPKAKLKRMEEPRTGYNKAVLESAMAGTSALS